MGKKDCLTMNNLLYVICMCIQYTLVLKYYENILFAHYNIVDVVDFFSAPTQTILESFVI